MQRQEIPGGIAGMERTIIRHKVELVLSQIEKNGGTVTNNDVLAASLLQANRIGVIGQIGVAVAIEISEERGLQ